MIMTRKTFGFESIPVYYRRPKVTYSCSRFYIQHHPIENYYEIGIFDQHLLQRIKEIAEALPDSLQIVESPLDGTAYAYIEESRMSIKLKSPEELMTYSDDAEAIPIVLSGTMVKVFAGSNALFDKLTDWAFRYPTIIRGEIPGEQSPGFPCDDEFMIPIEMISVELKTEMLPIEDQGETWI